MSCNKNIKNIINIFVINLVIYKYLYQLSLLDTHNLLNILRAIKIKAMPKTAKAKKKVSKPKTKVVSKSFKT